jgi:error-prone DNA polymerase
LQCLSAFSFLRGASHAEELVGTAAMLGHAALGIADINTVAGVVRAHEAAKSAGLRLLVGSRLSFYDATPDLVCYPTDLAAWGRLTRLLTLGKSRVTKGDCMLDFDDLPEHAVGQAVLVVPPPDLNAGFRAALHRIRDLFGPAAWLAASRRHRGDDGRRLRALARLAQDCRLPLVATNDVLYHVPERRALQDVMTRIRLGCTIEAAGLALQPNAERYLKPLAEMARLFRDHPEALARTLEMVAACRFSLDEITYEYPDEPVPPGRTPDEHLADLAREGATLPRRRAGCGPRNAGQGARADRPARLRALLSDCV